MPKGPLVAHEIPMPPQYCLGAEQEQTLTEPSTKVRGSLDEFGRQNCQREFLPPGKTRWAGVSTLQYSYLLTEQQDLEVFLTFRPSEQTQEIKVCRKKAC